jgi:hypothetical protein
MGRACITNELKRIAFRILSEKQEGKRPLVKQGVGGWIILKWILEG